MSGPFSLSMYDIVFSLCLLVNIFSNIYLNKCFTDFRAEPLTLELLMLREKTTPKTMRNTKSATIAMLLSQVVLNLSILISNSLIPVQTMHYSIKMLSELSYMKFTHDFIILNVYGLGRCNPDQVSSVLYVYTINDDMYWPIINKIIINVVLYCNTLEKIVILHNRLAAVIY